MRANMATGAALDRSTSSRAWGSRRRYAAAWRWLALALAAKSASCIGRVE
jgi:hypothetical protein